MSGNGFCIPGGALIRKCAGPAWILVDEQSKLLACRCANLAGFEHAIGESAARNIEHRPAELAGREHLVGEHSPQQRKQRAEYDVELAV